VRDRIGSHEPSRTLVMPCQFPAFFQGVRKALTMATVQELSNGRKRVRFYDHEKIRRSVTFGKIPRRHAESHAGHIEELVNAKRGRYAADGRHFEWVAEQAEPTRRHLAKLGLIPPIEEPEAEEPPEVPTLEAWFDRYIENRPGSDGSRKVWNRAKNQAVKFFGADRLISEIQAADAIDWFERMQCGKKALAETTARKMVSVARQVFKRAVKAKHIAENPFQDDELPTSIGNREKEYVSTETVQQALAVLPSAEWKAVLVFARYAGMRVQSELPLLRWTDIDEQENRFAVYSPKTKRTRQVPLFPEIRKALDDLRPITGESEFVLNVLREKSNNWRTPLEKILKREGIEPWKPLFNCLRSSAEIDIAAEFGVVAATEWVGNSVQVAMRHYLRTTAADFERAAGTGPILGPDDTRKASQGSEELAESAATEPQKTRAKRRKPHKKRDGSVIGCHRDEWTILDSNQ